MSDVSDDELLNRLKWADELYHGIQNECLDENNISYTDISIKTPKGVLNMGIQTHAPPLPEPAPPLSDKDFLIDLEHMEKASAEAKKELSWEDEIIAIQHETFQDFDGKKTEQKCKKDKAELSLLENTEETGASESKTKSISVLVPSVVLKKQRRRLKKSWTE